MYLSHIVCPLAMFGLILYVEMVMPQILIESIVIHKLTTESRRHTTIRYVKIQFILFK